jgi:hypothetical protein
MDRSSLEIKRFTMESDQLPPETSMCEVSTTNEYQGTNSLGLLLPRESHSHDIMRDTTETERVTTFSGCQNSTASLPASQPEAGSSLPEGISFELAFAGPLDAASAAAGDPISARLTTAILQPKSRKVLASPGAVATGRILRMEHRFVPDEYFLVSIAFDTLQGDGVTFRLRATSGRTGFDEQSREGNADWPQGTFRFPARNTRNLLAAGFKSTWRTTAVASRK